MLITILSTTKLSKYLNKSIDIEKVQSKSTMILNIVKVLFTLNVRRTSETGDVYSCSKENYVFLLIEKAKLYFFFFFNIFGSN